MENKKPKKARIYNITDKGLEEIKPNPNNKNLFDLTNDLKYLTNDLNLNKKIYGDNYKIANIVSKLPVNAILKQINNLSPFIEKAAHIKELTDSFNRMRNYAIQVDKDKKAVANNTYVDLLENDLQTKDYTINYLKKEIEQQNKILKNISLLANQNIVDTSNLPKEKKKLIHPSLTFSDLEISYNTVFFRFNNVLFENLNKAAFFFIAENKTLPTPILLKKDVTIRDLRYFIDELIKYKVLIPSILTYLEKIKAFEHNAKIVTAKRLKDAKDSRNTTPPKLAYQIDKIFELYI